jgi:aerobic carbon-monoxide dehydrogenase small subunit
LKRYAVQFCLNGVERAETIDSCATLLATLRSKFGDLSVKPGCLQGTCGACTVLVNGEIHLACLTLAEDCEGKNIDTVRGLEDETGLHPLQQAFIDCFAAQCGFCTPGMIMAAKALLDGNRDPTRAQVIEAISGNICRCTGYEPIITAILQAAASRRSGAA